MKFLGFLVLMLCHSSRAFPAPVDTVVVRAQQWGVVGAQRVQEQVFLNGVSLSGTSREFNNIMETISTDALLLAFLSVNHTSGLGTSGPGVPLPQVLIPILGLLALAGLITISLLLSQNRGLGHPGGVIGSLIHYPQDITESAPDTKGHGYRTL